MPSGLAISIPMAGTLWQRIQNPQAVRVPTWPLGQTDAWHTTNRAATGPVGGISALWQSPVTGAMDPGWNDGPIMADSRAGSFWGAISTFGDWIRVKAATLFGGPQISYAQGGARDGFLWQRQRTIIASARRELAAGVKETGGANRGHRVDQYARNAKMSVGGMWCGYFVGFNYSQAGFQAPERLASVLKARCFFLYRSLSSADPAISRHLQQGQTRQFFMLPESPSRRWIMDNRRLFPNYNADAHTFHYWRLPVRTGDTVLFDRSDNANGRHPTHMGLVESYDPQSGRLVTIEGNVNNRVIRKTYDLRDARVRREIAGFGRPAPGDFA